MMEGKKSIGFKGAYFLASCTIDNDEIRSFFGLPLESPDK